MQRLVIICVLFFQGVQTGAQPSLPNVFAKEQDYIGEWLTSEAGKAFNCRVLPATKKEWEDYRIPLRKLFMEKLKICVDHDLPLDIQVMNERNKDGFTVKNIVFQTRPDIYATATLYIPNGTGPFPAVLCLVGHHREGRSAVRVQQPANALVTNGFVVLSIDPWGAGERTTEHGDREYHGGNLGSSLLNVGETLTGMQVIDNMRALDLLCSLPYVDTRRIGATGASGGGHQTMWIAALDDRIAAAMPVASIGTFRAYVTGTNCICETVVDGLTFSEWDGLLALIAPRPLRIGTAFRETIHAFVPAEMFSTFKRVRPVYAFYGADENLSHFIADVVHGYWPDFQESMLGWFELHLKGKGTGAPKQFIDLPIDPVEELMSFEVGKRDRRVTTTAEYCRAKGLQLRADMLKTKEFDPEAKKKELAQLLRLSEEPTIRKIERLPSVQGWDRAVIETTFGSLIPVLYRPPADKSMRYVVFCNTDGKNNIPVNSYDAATVQGDGVALLDLWGTGESSSALAFERDGDREGFRHHTLSRSALWLGKRMIGQWVSEMEAVTYFLTSECGAKEVKMIADREAGLAALFTSVFNPYITEVELDHTPSSYLFDERKTIDNFTMAVHLPDIMLWGDVSLAVALSQNVKFDHPVTLSGRELTEDEKDAFHQECEMMKAMKKDKEL